MQRPGVVLPDHWKLVKNDAYLRAGDAADGLVLLEQCRQSAARVGAYKLKAVLCMRCLVERVHVSHKVGMGHAVESGANEWRRQPKHRLVGEGSGGASLRSNISNAVQTAERKMSSRLRQECVSCFV